MVSADPESGAALSALRAWVDALNGYGDLALTSRAVAADVVIERGGFGPQSGEVVQTLQGVAAANTWLAMTRHVVRFFAQEASLRREGSLWVARYRLTAPDDFVGGGLWRFATDASGRIARLQHWPDDLPTDT